MILQLCDKDWAARIKVEKFRSHNQQWLDMVESINVDTITSSLPAPEEEDDGLAPFGSDNFLKHTMLFPSGIQILVFIVKLFYNNLFI